MQTTDKNNLELYVPVTADAANDSSVCDNDSNEGDLDLEDDPSDTHEDEDTTRILHDTSSQEWNYS